MERSTIGDSLPRPTSENAFGGRTMEVSQIVMIRFGVIGRPVDDQLTKRPLVVERERINF